MTSLWFSQLVMNKFSFLKYSSPYKTRKKREKSKEKYQILKNFPKYFGCNNRSVTTNSNSCLHAQKIYKDKALQDLQISCRLNESKYLIYYELHRGMKLKKKKTHKDSSPKQTHPYSILLLVFWVVSQAETDHLALIPMTWPRQHPIMKRKRRWWRKMKTLVWL